MKLFLMTPAGEEGPFTPAQINRMHAQGKVKPEQLCRVDGAEGMKPISEVFRHFAPDAAVATAAQKKVAAYNRAAGGAAVYTGVTMLFIGLLSVCFFNPYGIGFGLIIIGGSLVGKGRSQERRGDLTNPPLIPEHKQTTGDVSTAQPESANTPASSKEERY